MVISAMSRGRLWELAPCQVLWAGWSERTSRPTSHGVLSITYLEGEPSWEAEVISLSRLLKLNLLGGIIARGSKTSGGICM